MVKPAPLAHNPDARTIARVLAALILPTMALTWFIWVSGLDNSLAHSVYEAHSPWARALRNNGALPGGILGILALILCLIPGLWRRYPTVYRTALAYVAALVFGAGLLNQVVLQDIFDRPRPRESALLDVTAAQTVQASEGFRGNSMPSGHAAMGFALMTPFFVLRRSRPRTAMAFLAAGAVYGSVVGLSRMVMGAHFFTDVLVAGGIGLVSGYLAALFAEKVRYVPVRYILALFAVAVAAVILGNHFRMTLVQPLGAGFTRADLPCNIVAVPNMAVTVPTLSVELEGYGAPLSQLALVQGENGVVRLQTSRGIYHSLACTAILATPAAPAWE